LPVLLRDGDGLMDLREKFVAAFGVEETEAVENAARQHKTNPGPIGDTIKTPGFKGVISRVISWACVSSPNYAKEHGITIDPAQFKVWVHDNAGLTSEDADFWGYMSGAYEGFIRVK